MSNDNWRTPADVFEELDRRYWFTMDGAADMESALEAKWMGPGGVIEDATSTPWPVEERIFFNPPYSRGNIAKWVARAIQHADSGGFSVGLLPADVSTRVFHNIHWNRYPVEFFPRRLRFVGAPAGAKFGSMIVEFRKPLS